MKTVTATDFYKHMGRWTEEVSSSGVPIVVTHRGKPVVRIEPVEKPEQIAPEQCEER